MKEYKIIRKLLENKVKNLTMLIAKAEASIKKAPKGKLILSCSKGAVQYYHKTDSTQKRGTYIPKKNEKLIRALAQKDYDIRFVDALIKQKSTILKIMKLLPEIEPEEMIRNISEQRKLLIKPHILNDEEYKKQWQSVVYKGKEMYTDTAVFVTEKGEKVRSKSEKIIADKLYMLGIPYRYEYPLKLKGYGIVYPDFTLLNVETRQELYMEHFGMMDNPEYCQKAILKLEDYARNGIFPGKGLLVTFETSEKPLNMQVFEKKLKAYMGCD